MSAISGSSMVEDLHKLKFDIQDALLKVRQDKPIDMSGIDERVEQFCDDILKASPDLREQADPIMTEVISLLEELAYALQDAIDSDDGEDDWSEDQVN